MFPGCDERVGLFVLHGRTAILSNAEVFGELAQRCGQAGAMHWMGYFLDGLGGHWKRPCMVVFAKPGADPKALQVGDVLAAALYFELRSLGVGTGAYFTDCIDGLRTVVAPAGMHGLVAAKSTEELMRRGAHAVMTTYGCRSPEPCSASALLRGKELLWTEPRRIARTSMELAATYEGTLEKFGKRTRANFRYYRKRLRAKLECEYVADARNLVTEADALAMNARSLNPETKSEVRRRHRAACSLPGGFLSGLRAVNGDWLSLIGGWRQGATTILQFQANAAGYEKDSICTVMRSYFLEDEVNRSTGTLTVYHGTPHSMGNSFAEDELRDLVVVRRSLQARVLKALAFVFVSQRGGAPTLFARTLTNQHLEWTAAEAVDLRATGMGLLGRPGVPHWNRRSTDQS